MLQRALALAEEMGLPVFPCFQNKHPATTRGFYDATVRPEIIKTWSWHNRLIGVPTGSPSNLNIVDIDVRHEGDVWLFNNIDRLPETRTHETRSGGIHLLYNDAGLANSAGTDKAGIAPGVDVRGQGGYVIWWPTHDYPLVNDHAIADLPNWVIEQLRPSRITRRPILAGPVKASSEYIVGALRSATQQIRTASEGTRNQTLNDQAFSMARFANINIDLITSSLTRAALDVGLPPREIANTIDSAFTARAKGSV